MSAIVALQTDLDLANAKIANHEARLQRLETTPTPSSKLLFASGFEGGVFLNSPSTFGNGAWQSIGGVDSVSGFSWPPNIWGGSVTSLQMSVSGVPVNDLPTLNNYQTNRIETIIGHKGTPTKALFSEILQSGTSGVNPMGGAYDQDALMMQPVGETSDLYISYWIKYQPNLLQLMNLPQSNWRLLFEWKTGYQGDDGDYRLSATLVTWGLPDPLSWHIAGDNVASPAGAGSGRQIFWEKYVSVSPQTLADWMKFEVFWHHSTGSDGRIWMAVNGQVIVDRYGPNKIAAPINRIFMPNLYASTAFPVYQWVDDIEIWDGFPPSNGTNPPYAQVNLGVQVQVPPILPLPVTIPPITVPPITFTV